MASHNVEQPGDLLFLFRGKDERDIGIRSLDAKAPGKHILYLPSRIFIGKDEDHRREEWKSFSRWDPVDRQWHKLGQGEYNPLYQHPNVLQLPVRVPFGFPSLLNPHHHLLTAIGKPIRAVRFSTTQESRTRISPAIGNIPSTKVLVTVKYCANLARNLRRYADPMSEGVEPVNEAMQDFYHFVYGRRYATGQDCRGMTTFGGPAQLNVSEPYKHRTLDFPTAIHQQDAIWALAAWYLGRNHDVPEIVESESGIETAVHKLLLTPLNHILRTRYQSRATLEGLINATYKETGPDSVNTSIREVKTSARTWKKQIQYPRYGRSTGAVLDKPEGGRSKAGYDDFVLFDEKGEKTTMCVEVKSYWVRAYTDRVYENLGKLQLLVDPATQQFLWKTSKPRRSATTRVPDYENTLLQQVWGQLHYSNNVWGFSTNGSKVLIYIRTGITELTIAPLMNINDAELLQTLAGLAFASIDHGVRALPGDPYGGLPQYLCHGSSLTVDDLEGDDRGNNNADEGEDDDGYDLD
ncbi:hypothetical protein C8Q77DRAFT_876933 [Trametes polyzona]|nr:hypothetical protein C8Q77DRAFT_876933 [Trametes polyzona]